MSAATTLRAVSLNITKDGIAVIRMIRGDNKWNQPFINDMREALIEVERNKDVRCLIFTGQGKFFSYGLDLHWIALQTKNVTRKFLIENDDLLQRITLFPLPTIAAINGHAFGMGAIFAMACDYRVMKKGRGWFCLPETKLKIKFSPIKSSPVGLKLHRSQTLRDAAIFSKRFTAEEARRADIIDEAVDENELMAAAIRYGNEIAGEVLDRGCVYAAKDKLYGAPIRAKRDEEIQRMTEKDEDDWLEGYIREARLLASKM
ncbi:enoyl-CoA delta isomerase 2, peroxisomal-like [Lytechinus variegatus]|uniref:enoyl-CoA delta isomerase 2, peroxisomal-like n=1 Tax=Lytechinus variegatus TaxID=7654 RepID=UPI001BB193F4|nr:enoyl-CoA delta isomerase 2, peroxisomal-like [Lytechinus variegatus]